MNQTIKALLAKKWKDEELDLFPGTYEFDEVLVVRVTGSAEKQEDQLVTPLLWEKCGVEQDQAMNLLREAITEAMDEGVSEDPHIKSRIEDVNSAIAAVRKDLLARLPKMPRVGRTITKDMRVSVMPLAAIEAAA